MTYEEHIASIKGRIEEAAGAILELNALDHEGQKKLVKSMEPLELAYLAERLIHLTVLSLAGKSEEGG